MTHPFARRMSVMRPSTIREILKVTTQPDVISFAGGLPAPELFPVAAIQASCNRVLSTMGSQALQYGATEGFAPLREWLTGEMARRGIAATSEEIILTSGSQQGLDLLGKVFLDAGDAVLTENPTYLAAIQAFQSQEARFVPVPTDGEGLIPAALPELVARHRPKFLYIIPNFQNPTGITLTAARRRELHAAAGALGLLVVEDDPYGKLRYSGEELAPLKALDGAASQVIYLSTFSKTIAPGLRLGWMVAAPEILARVVVAKQATDLHTSSLDQRVAYDYLTAADPAPHLERIRTAYGERFAVMDRALRAAMPRGFDWTHPQGGMFLWVACPDGLDTASLLQTALRHKVVFVPGRDFFPDGGGQNYLRLNFSNSAPARIEEGVGRLAALCREALEG